MGKVLAPGQSSKNSDWSILSHVPIPESNPVARWMEYSSCIAYIQGKDVSPKEEILDREAIYIYYIPHLSCLTFRLPICTEVKMSPRDTMQPSHLQMKMHHFLKRNNWMLCLVIASRSLKQVHSSYFQILLFPSMQPLTDTFQHSWQMKKWWRKNWKTS